MPSTSFLDQVQVPQNFNPAPAPFDLLVSDLFLKLESVNAENKAPYTSISAKKTSIIESFVDTWRTHFGNNIYSAVRLIFPNRDGRKYHIKDVALTRLVTKLLNLQKGSMDYSTIKNWKRSYHQKARLANPLERRELSDLPVVVSRIISRRRDPSKPVKSSVSVADVNQVLDTLTQKTLAEEQVELLNPFIAKLTIPEVRFFFSIILKESMLSFLERSFFVAWHPDAYDLYKVCSDMKKIFWLLTDPSQRLSPSQLCVQPMYQFVPQSSKKLEISYEALCKKMTVPLKTSGVDRKLVKAYVSDQIEGSYLIEEKIDGDRMLMHMVNGKFLWHTRRRRDYTLVYGENVHVGSLTKHLANAFNKNVKSIVLDGEMVAWSKDKKAILPFGTLRSAAIQEALKQFDIIDVYEGNNSWPLFIIFDILHLNGEDLSGLPLFYRKSLLAKVVNEVPHIFEILRWIKAKTPSDLKANMQQIVSDNNEGIMVKSLLSKYRVYSRDSTWIKVKPEYLESFGENLDLVVIGKIGRVKTSYMCGLRDDDNDGVFKSFCLVANGFSDAVYRRIESKLCNYWVEYKDRKPSTSILQFGSKKPDFWIDPANSIVLEIKARSIEATAETPYAAGSTLHNLWCRSIRNDKSYDECISLQEYQDLKLRYSQDIYKSQRVNRNRKRDYDFQDSIYQKYDHGKKRKVKVETEIFKGLKFIIATESYSEDGEVISIEEIKRSVVENGGEIWLDLRANDPDSLHVLIVGEVTTPRLGRWINDGFDIISPQWVFECIIQQKLVPLEKQDMYYTNNQKLLEQLKNRTDEFGDSYTRTGKSSAGWIGQVIGLQFEKQLTKHCLEQMAEKLAYENTPVHRRLFENVSFYILADESLLSKSEYSRIEQRIERFSGTVVQTVDNCGFIVVPRWMDAASNAKRQVHELLKKVAANYDERKKLAYIVHEKFISDSIFARELVDETQYLCVGGQSN